MLKNVINFLKCLIFGCEEKSKEQEWLEKKVKEKEEKLEEIENEETDLDDVIKRLNSDD